MRKYLYIGIGGLFGAVMRYQIKSISFANYAGQFPVNTLAVNLAGCFLLALIMTVTLEMLRISEDARLGISVGAIGAFTTFSTLCKEVAMLIMQGYYLTAVLYTISSVIAGLAITYSGYRIAQRLIAEYKIRNKRLQSVNSHEEREGG